MLCKQAMNQEDESGRGIRGRMKKELKIKSKRRYIGTSCLFAAVVWMSVIFWFSAKPAQESAQMSHRVGGAVCKILVPGYEEKTPQEKAELAKRIDYPVRKFAHAAEYALLGLLFTGTFYGYGMEGRKLWLTASGFAVFYAVSDELHQLFVPGRSGQISDVILDSAGVAVGVALGILCVKSVKKVLQSFSCAG